MKPKENCKSAANSFFSVCYMMSLLCILQIISYKNTQNQSVSWLSGVAEAVPWVRMDPLPSFEVFFNEVPVAQFIFYQLIKYCFLKKCCHLVMSGSCATSVKFSLNYVIFIFILSFFPQFAWLTNQVSLVPNSLPYVLPTL